MRFIVTEIRGDLDVTPSHSSRAEGLSCQVIDTLCNHRVMATFRTEECPPRLDSKGRMAMPRGIVERRILVRELAERRAAELEEQCRG